MSADLVLRNARRYGFGGSAATELIDVWIAGGRIARIVPSDAGSTAASTALAGRSAVESIDLEGRFVGPGLWDSHVHFTQWVIGSRRVDLTGTRSAEEVLAAVREARATGHPLVDGMLIGYGFRDGDWPVPATLAALEVVESGVPVMLISADLHCGWMNSLAAERLGVTLDESGIVAETPWIAAQQRFGEAESLGHEDFRAVADAAASRGVVGIVDFEIADNLAEWPARIAAGVRSLRVEAAVWPDRLDAAIAAGLRTGDELAGTDGLARMGRLKVAVDGSLNTRTAWCWDPYPGLDPHAPHACGMELVPMDELQALLERARDAGIGAAVHAIGDRANTEVLDVFERLYTGTEVLDASELLGMRGVIEHAQLVREEDFPRFAELGLAASVQPEHAMDDRDVAERYWVGRTGGAFAFASLLRAGAELRLGSDAPVAPLDPWIGISAAVSRSRDGRESWHPEQRLPLDVALAASARTSLAVGEPADLVVVDRDPFAGVDSAGQGDADALRRMPVAATLLGGRFTWKSL